LIEQPIVTGVADSFIDAVDLISADRQTVTGDLCSARPFAE
jgi:hypothetical protein